MKKDVFSIAPGTTEYERTAGEFKHRIHLRVETDGHGVLLINANRIYHFNPSATLMAHAILEKMDEKTAIKALQKAFDVHKKQASADFAYV